MRNWHPEQIADTAEDLTLDRRPLPRSTGGAVYLRYADGHAAIVIDPRLTGAERHDALAHELVHHERGGGAAGGLTPRFRPDRAREESRVRRIVAERLVPTLDLQRFCEREADLGHGVGPVEVMVEFDVSRLVACDALDNLTDLERGVRRATDAVA